MHQHPLSRLNTNRTRLAPLRRILVVEDDADLVQMLSVMLQSHFDFTIRRSAREALACFDAEKPDLVLVDFELQRDDGPGDDGLWLVGALRRLGGPQVPLVVMANAAWQQEPCRQAGVDAVIAKPFGQAELLGLLDAVCRHADPVGHVGLQVEREHSIATLTP